MNSRIILSKNIKLDKNYNNVLSYSESNMVTLCQANAVATNNDYTFIRQNKNRISTHFTFSQCIQSNYIAFQNYDYSNKWFFAFIDEVIYKNDGTTEIQYTIDEWSTWFDYWQKKNCFLVREHVNDDTVGLHTIPENIDIGDLIAENSITMNEIGAESYFYIVVACNFNPANSTEYIGIGAYAGYPQGSIWFAWLVNNENYASTLNEISNWIRSVDSAGRSSWINQIFALPYQAFSFTGDIDENNMVITGKGQKLNVNRTFSKSVFRQFNGFTPKNGKVYCYPYSFARITNNSGAYIDYHIEDFESENSDNMTFNFIGIPCIGYSAKIRPVDYRGLTYNEDESLQLGKYPTLSWTSDAFTNWLTQNATSMQTNTFMNIFGSAISGATAIMTGNPIGLAGAIASVSSTASNLIGGIDKASMQPSNAQGNANTGDLNFAFNLDRFKIMHMRPKLEQLQIIDDYFSRYGYKINRIKNPNITGRRYWNYVEIGPNDEIGNGQVPSSSMEIINNSARRGITIWHNHDNIGNFNLTNSII